MIDPATLAFHEDSFREYLTYWRDPAERQRVEMPESEAAYHLIAHAGMLSRGQESDGLPEDLAMLPPEDRARLVTAACDFAAHFSLPASLQRTLECDALDDDELAEYEQIMLDRDELDVVIEASQRLVGDAILEDDELLSRLARMVCVAGALDEQLRTRPDIVAVASRILVGVRALDWLKNGSHPDWFAEARKWDEELSSADLSDLLRLASGRRDAHHQPAKPATTAHARARDTEFATAAGEGN